MESRLPKPKIILKKAISTIDMNVKNNNNKIGRNEDTSASTSSSNSKSINGNKSAMKPTLVRAKTLSVITRSKDATAVKRTATAVTYGEAKRPFVKSTAKTIVNKSANNNALMTNNKSNKVVQNNTHNKLDTIKKWDLRGRLAQTSDKLSVAQQKNKDIESKYATLQELVNNLQVSETLHRTKAQELEISNSVLTNKLQSLTEETSALREHQENLTQQLKESKELCKSLSCTLNEIQEKYKAQEILILGQTKELTMLKSDLESQTKINKELETLSHNMDKERRILRNSIQELKGNIRVFCRVRPRTPQEVDQMKAICSINFTDDCIIEINKLDGSDTASCSGKSKAVKQEFSFDKVFAPNASQQDVFEELSLLVQSALEGYNVCVFAYGQTGSGKTYTMEGEYGLETEGMISRTVRHIFQEMKQFELLGWNYRIEASFLEIYNEHIVDLLDCKPKTHEIRMVNSKGQDVYVSNLKIKEIHSPEELHKCLYTAQQNRAVAATQANERSSRSHSVAQIRLIGTHSKKQEVSIGNLNLVDLAGSERLKSEEAARNAETKNINKSLANLGNVILALLKKQEHVPYRNSKLTHLLMPSLGGNSKTLMLLNISPLNECYNETLNSLRFGSNVNSCKTGNIKRSRTVLQNITN